MQHDVRLDCRNDVHNGVVIKLEINTLDGRVFAVAMPCDQTCLQL